MLPVDGSGDTPSTPTRPRDHTPYGARRGAGRGRKALGDGCVHMAASGLPRCDRWDHLPGNGRGPVEMGRITVSLSFLVGLVKPVFLITLLIVGLVFASHVLPGLIRFDGIGK